MIKYPMTKVFSFQWFSFQTAEFCIQHFDFSICLVIGYLVIHSCAMRRKRR
jgi:hypothetical protein